MTVSKNKEARNIFSFVIIIDRPQSAAMFRLFARAAAMFKPLNAAASRSIGRRLSISQTFPNMTRRGAQSARLAPRNAANSWSMASRLAAGLISSALTLHASRCELKHSAEQLIGMIPDNVELRDVRSFIKYQKNGSMNRSSFKQALNSLGIKDAQVIDSFFECFDTDRNGELDFREFASALAIIGCKGTPKERLRFMFASCDLDGDGVVQKEELRKMIMSLLVTRENLWISDNPGFSVEEVGDAGSPFLGLSVSPTSVSWSESKNANAFARFQKQERLRDIWTSYPFTKGLPLKEALGCLSDVSARHIFYAADANNDDRITFQEFSNWATSGR